MLVQIARSVTFRCPAASPLAEERVVHDNFGIFNKPCTPLRLSANVPRAGHFKAAELQNVFEETFDI